MKTYLMDGRLVQSYLLAILVTPRLMADEPALRRFDFEQPHMGTKFRISLHAADNERATTASRAAFARVAQLNKIMSDYDQDSELMRLCRAFATGTEPAIKVSEELFFVFAEGQKVARASDGSFDMTDRKSVV